MATIQKRGNTYKITVSCGYDLNGKQIRKTMTWKPDENMTDRQIQKELERQKVLFEEKCQSGQVLDGNIKFSDFSEKWFCDYAAEQLRPKTLARYKTMMPRINAAIGHIRLSRLQPHHLIEFYKNLGEAGIRSDLKYNCKVDFMQLLKSKSLTKKKWAEKAGVSLSTLASITQGKNITSKSAERISTALNLPVDSIFEPVNADSTLSQKTILHHHRLISSILATAVKWQVIFSNPCERVQPPKAESKEANYLDEDGVARLLQALDQKANPQQKTIIRLLIYTGLRRGELCGLEWSDIDFENSVLHVRRSSLYLPDRGIFTDETKNSTSNRSIKIPCDAVKMLRRFRTWQMEHRLQIGDQWHDSGRIFTAWNGDPIHPDIITNWFSRFVKENGLPPVSIHSLRHTNATILIAAGTNLQTVANRLGHANVTTTEKIYSHAIKSADAAAADTLQDFLNPLSKKKKA